MPPDQTDLFSGAARSVAVVLSAPTVKRVEGSLSIMGKLVTLDQLEHDLNTIYDALTGPMAYRRTFGATAKAIADAAWPYDKLQGRAQRIRAEIDDQEAKATALLAQWAPPST